MKVKELLSDESKWIRHNNAEDKEGRWCNHQSKDAVSFCLMDHCYPELHHDQLRKLEAAISKLFPHYGQGHFISVLTFNDNESFAAVRQVVELADV